ncbi:MAG: hypothetical protein VKQ33_03555 [Candidatus Sericytochromatia bacterium]|nr:hypothetical protein [Candidatus Sericytochromatia bacterium]
MSVARPRWAGPADNAALIALNRACPMAGALTLCFDRHPDYFALSRLQGAGAEVLVVDGPGRLDGAAAVAALPAVYVEGAPREVFYACDLRVHPQARGGRVLKRLYDALTDHGVHARGWDLGVTAVMGGNAAMRPVLAGKGGVLHYHPLGLLHNHLLFGPLRRPRAGHLRLRRATPADVDAMVALWNRLQCERQFAPVWTPAWLRGWLGLVADRPGAPGVGPEAYWLAFEGDALVGFALAWDQRALKRLVLVDEPGWLPPVRAAWGLGARALGRPPLPRPGEAVPYVVVTHLCTGDVAVAGALLQAAWGDARAAGALYLSVMFDARDPLAAAVRGWLRAAVPIAPFAMDPLGRWDGEALARRLVYFDVGLV